MIISVEVYMFYFPYFQESLGERWAPAVLKSELELNFIKKAQRVFPCGRSCGVVYWIGGTSQANSGWINYIGYSQYIAAETGNKMSRSCTCVQLLC